MIIIIGASKNNKIGSHLIQWWIGANYSHVYVRWNLKSQNRDIVYQASHGMVHFREYNNFKSENTVIEEIEIELTDEQFKKFSCKCIDLAGKPYSKIELIQIVLNNITNNNIRFEDQPGYICSELMGELLKDLGYVFNKQCHLINPKDIIETLKKGK